MKWKRVVILVLVAICYSIYYLSIGIFGLKMGYFNYEQLFISDKLQLLFSSDTNTLEVFYFTYPVLGQVMAIPAGLIDPIIAPIITSSLFTGFLAAYLVTKLISLDLKFFACITSAYFIFSPVMIFVAMSGMTLYLFLILYFLFFHYVFKYSRDLTTYNFVIISICLSAFVFLDFSFLWIIVFMIPLVFLFSIYSDPHLKPNFIAIFNQITLRNDKVKELIGRFLSSLLVIIFTPLISLLFYLLINYWFTGQWFYFKNLSTSQWDQKGFLNYTFSNSLIKESFTIKYVLKTLFYLSSFFLTALWLGRRRLLFTYSLIMVVLWIIFNKNYDGTQFFSLNTLLILTASGIAGILHLFQTSLIDSLKNKTLTSILISTVFVLTLTGEVFYFKSTRSALENNMVDFVFKKNANEEMTAFLDMADFIKTNLNKTDIILTDNSIFYPVTAMTRTNISYLDQYNESYYSAIQFPKKFANYILVSNLETEYYTKDQMTAVKLQRESLWYKVYSNDFFTIYKL